MYVWGMLSLILLVPSDFNPFITNPDHERFVPLHRGLCPLLFTNSSEGSFTSHTNQKRAVRRDLWFFILIRED